MFIEPLGMLPFQGVAMTYKRLLFCTLMLVFCFRRFRRHRPSRQRPGPQFWRRLGCQRPIEPRTKLEAFDERYGTVVLKGFTQINSIEVVVFA